MQPVCEISYSCYRRNFHTGKASDSRGFINILSLDNNGLNSAVVMRLILLCEDTCKQSRVLSFRKVITCGWVVRIKRSFTTIRYCGVYNFFLVSFSKLLRNSITTRFLSWITSGVSTWSLLPVS